MSFKLNIKKALCHVSEKVKNVDVHETNPWVLSALYDGHAEIYNFETQSTVKSFEVSKDHLRAACFVPGLNWIVAAGDDKMLRIINYNTMERVDQVEAHSDYVRSLSCHPTRRLILSASDDYTVKLWEFSEQGKLRLKSTFAEHQNFVMDVQFNPRDPNYFASCSLDTYIKMWSINSASSNYTLKEHIHGVNSIAFHPR